MQAGDGGQPGVFQRAAQAVAPRAPAQNMKARDLKKIRADDIDLISEHCVTGWAGVLDAKEKAVDFTVEDCQKLLGALPYWLLDDFRNEVANPEVFIELADPGDLEDQAGN